MDAWLFCRGLETQQKSFHFMKISWIQSGGSSWQRSDFKHLYVTTSTKVAGCYSATGSISERLSFWWVTSAWHRQATRPTAPRIFRATLSTSASCFHGNKACSVSRCSGATFSKHYISPLFGWCSTVVFAYVKQMALINTVWGCLLVDTAVMSEAGHERWGKGGLEVRGWNIWQKQRKIRRDFKSIGYEKFDIPCWRIWHCICKCLLLLSEGRPLLATHTHASPTDRPP